MGELVHHGGLDAVVVGHDVQVTRATNVGLARAHLADEVLPVGAQRVARGARHDVGVRVTESAGQRPLRAQVTREASGVDSLDDRYAVSHEKALEFLGRTPVRAQRRELAHHEPAAPGLVRLVVERRHSVISNVRIGERDDLTRVTGVGDDFLISRERGVEHELARHDAALGQETRGVTLEGRTVA